MAPGPTSVDIVVEVPRAGFVKRTPRGTIDFVSPLPCPFNYGCVPDLPSGDGDPLDAVLLGPRQPRGATLRAQAYGVVRFVDAGCTDDKLVCGTAAPSAAQWALVHVFFRVYAVAKGLLNRLRGKRGATRVVAVERFA